MSLNLGIIASSRATAPSAALLLDTYTGAAAAYSLRKLRTAYTGAAIRVRRSSDNTETDIGFVAGVLDTDTLLTFCGGLNGFVSVWYDQSGNSRNTSQTTLLTQPQIVNSGTLLTKNTKPTISFDSTGLTSAINFTGSSGTLINVTSTTTDTPRLNNGSPNGNIGISTFAAHQPFSDGVIYESFATDTRKTVGNPTNNTTNLYIYNVVSDANLFNVKINNSTFFNTTTNTVAYNTTTNYFRIGSSYSIQQNTSYPFFGFISEIIIYTNNQNSNISGINTNINSFYTIY